MFLIDTTTKNIQAKTLVAPASNLQCIVQYNDTNVDLSNVPIGPTELTSGISNAYADIVPTVIDYQKRQLIYCSIYNPNAASHTVLIALYNTSGPSTTILHRIKIKPLNRAEYIVGSGWVIYDENGLKKNDEQITIKDSANLDAFQRFRISAPQTIFDSKQLADKQPLFWDDQQTSGGGTTSTHTANNSLTTMAVSNLTAGIRVRQTFRRFNYQPGKSQLILLTAIFGASATGITRQAGLFDDNNGLFFKQTSSGFGVVVRTYTSGAAVDTITAQSSWNIDPMDGTGASGITLDFEKAQIFLIDFEWLGVGRIRFGVVVGGIIYYVHEILNDNSLTTVYISTPNLPLRYSIQNNGSGTASNLKHICSTVISEGGMQETGFPFGLNRGDTALTTLNNNSFYPLIAIRLNSSYLGSTVRIKDFNIICTSTAAYNYVLILNPSVVGTALAWTALTNSSIDYQVNTTNATTVTGGTVLHSGTIQNQNEGGYQDMENSDFSLGSNIAGTADILVLAVQRINGNTETFYASLNIKDQQ